MKGVNKIDKKVKQINENKKDKTKFLIWFSLLEGIGDKLKLELINKYDIEDIYKMKKEELIKIKLIGEKKANEILRKDIKEKAKEDYKYILKNNIKVISIKNEKYPKELREIYDPPIALYVKGNIENLSEKKKISIVGCREASEYGIKVARYFSYNLTKKDVVIVSGLAKGIDSLAHKGCLEAKGKTIAVLGTGIDIIYPKENANLFNEIIEKEGTIISEYPIGSKPNKLNFPKRNRIISGLSKGTIVVEARKRSGSLITADFALEQGRDLYAVPGNINSINSIGTNELIKDGIIVATNIKDIDI